MDSAVVTNNLLRTVKSDNDWFTSLMKVDLYAQAELPCDDG